MPLIEPCTATVHYMLTCFVELGSENMRMQEQVRAIPVHYCCADYTDLNKYLSVSLCTGAFLK